MALRQPIYQSSAPPMFPGEKVGFSLLDTAAPAAPVMQKLPKTPTPMKVPAMAAMHLKNVKATLNSSPEMRSKSKPAYAKWKGK